MYINSQRSKHLRNQRLDSAALFHVRDNYETIRDAGRSNEIRAYPEIPGQLGPMCKRRRLGSHYGWPTDLLFLECVYIPAGTTDNSRRLANANVHFSRSPESAG